MNGLHARYVRVMSALSLHFEPLPRVSNHDAGIEPDPSILSLIPPYLSFRGPTPLLSDEDY